MRCEAHSIPIHSYRQILLLVAEGHVETWHPQIKPGLHTKIDSPMKKKPQEL